MTSSSFITGTGLKKCSPQKRSNRLVLLAISPIGMDEVLLEKIVEGFATWKKTVFIPFLLVNFETHGVDGSEQLLLDF